MRAGKLQWAIPATYCNVPIYLAYTTAVATGRGIAFRDDVYGRDGSVISPPHFGLKKSR